VHALCTLCISVRKDDLRSYFVIRLAAYLIAHASLRLWKPLPESLLRGLALYAVVHSCFVQLFQRVSSLCLFSHSLAVFITHTFILSFQDLKAGFHVYLFHKSLLGVWTVAVSVYCMLRMYEKIYNARVLTA